jgi:hypothetical protein
VLLGLLAGATLALRSGFGSGGARAAITERVRAGVDQIAQIAQSARAAIGPVVREATPPASTPTVDATPRTALKSSRRMPRAHPVTISMRDFEPGTIPARPSLTIADDTGRADVRDETVYSDDDDDIEPAVLIHPKLPTNPPSTVSPEDIGVLEIVVSETGAVEQVHLISTADRFHERMIVAAAKAWPFEPATKDGHPVRYRTRIRITL